jgi:sigma-B regulation protein RsbQ
MAASYKVQNEGVDISYTVDGAGPISLVFVHGSFTDKTHWASQVDHFAAKYQVVTIDLAAHGESGRNRDDWSLIAFGKDVNAVIQALDLKQVILIGHSMGGNVAVEAAVAHPQPIVGIIGVDTFKNAATPLPAEYDEKVAELLDNLHKNFSMTSEEYVDLALVTSETPDAVKEVIRKAYRDAYPKMGVPVIMEVFQAYKREKELFAALQWKLYLVNVDYTPTNEAALQQFAPVGYELVNMHGTSHYPMLEKPEEFNRVLDQVIDRIVKNNMSIQS